MYTTFHTSANELDENFIKTLKSIFKSKRIAITVEEDLDETSYLLSTNANKAHLLDAVKDENSVSFSFEDLKKHSKKVRKKSK